jgi:HAD superfamily hydrolase (TIGR01450 family)
VTAEPPDCAAVTWLLDLDGVVWLADVALPGAADAVARLRGAGERVLFITNNSAFRVGDQEAKLAGMGIPAEGDVLTSAGAAARLLEPGHRAVVLGGAGIVEALEGGGVEVVEGSPADAVLVGFTRAFDYERLRLAAGVVRTGARLIGTNDDATYPTPGGPIPGGGALLAAVAVAAGVRPEVAGKPHPPMVALARAAAGDGPLTVVGDRPSTDGGFARALGARFALVLTGVTRADDLPVEPRPDVVASDLAALVASELAQR